MFAVKEGHVELLKECFHDIHVDYAITTKVCHCNNYVCQYAVVFVHVQKKQTVLHIAARAKHLDCLKEIMQNINVTDDIKIATDKV